MINNDEKTVRKPKGKRAQETQMFRGMPKSKAKMTVEIK